MLLGAIADDFTGASDLANTLAKGGMATTLFIGANGAAGTCDAGVVALKTRSIAVDEAVETSVEAARWLLSQGCEQILFKYCSTFDSTPSGNIGPVADALLDLLGADVTIVCPAFPATGRRVFMGHLFVGDRLLSESGMENHPLTPMTDPDLRRWLRRQTRNEVGHISLETIRASTVALSESIAAESLKSHRLIVTDAITDDDLHALGKAAAGHKLITGGSGIAIGLPQNFRDRGLLSGWNISFPAVTGPGIALCGSCSLASQAQVRQYLMDKPGLAIEPGALLAGDMDVARTLDWIASWKEHDPIIYSTADPAAVLRAQASFGREIVASTIERFFGELARSLANNGTRRIVVGGGETSGAVIEALGLRSLQIGAEIDPGVPALVADRGGTIGIALKSGNFGSNDFFAKAMQKVGQA